MDKPVVQPFIGRTAELDRLKSVWRQVRQGRPYVHVLRGESGLRELLRAICGNAIEAMQHSSHLEAKLNGLLDQTPMGALIRPGLE